MLHILLSYPKILVSGTLGTFPANFQHSIRDKIPSGKPKGSQTGKALQNEKNSLFFYTIIDAFLGQNKNFANLFFLISSITVASEK